MTTSDSSPSETPPKHSLESEPSLHGKIITVKAEVRVPTPPNFLFIDMPTVGQQELPKIDIADLDDEGLRSLGQAWTENLVEHAQARRKNRIGQPTPRAINR